MPRYIDALEIRYIHRPQTQDDIAYKDEIDKIPTADVAPVVHAHWILKNEMIRSPEAKNYNCSECGKESFAYPNCPFCRAIMDEEVKENA